jgi:hypothetical protein
LLVIGRGARNAANNPYARPWSSCQRYTESCTDLAEHRGVAKLAEDAELNPDRHGRRLLEFGSEARDRLDETQWRRVE